MGNWVDSKTDLTTDTLGFGEVGTVGGVGQLIYKLFRFKKYEIQNANGEILARPICRPGFEPEFFDSDGLTGADILASLYNLALKINDFSEKKPFDELIMNWCNTVAHPYFVDELATLMSEDEFDLAHESFFIERDGIFDVNDFMHDLGKLYQEASFAFALDCPSSRGWCPYRLRTEPCLCNREQGRCSKGHSSWSAQLSCLRCTPHGYAVTPLCL